MAEAMEQEKREKVILVGQGDESTVSRGEIPGSLAELEELVKTAGGKVVAAVVQNRESAHPGTYVGTGKAYEIAGLVEQTGADAIVCDDELSPAQLKNLGMILDVKILDRTQVILDIFAARAATSEGRIQVELAQLKYRMSRLAGLGRSMSRLGGGIGTRGPGEKKLEMDRRLINDRISQLKGELKEVQKHRGVNRAKRQRSHIPVAAIVGYTNAGKSTLFNHLTGASVYEENLLFATLDPTTRLLELDGRQQILLTDTVGFIRKLPHHLVEAFKSTLEEAKYADFILHVVDSSNPQYGEQMHTVYETLRQLGIREKKIITLFNKQDLRSDSEPLYDFQADHSLNISAARDEGLEQVKSLLEELLREDKIYVERTIPYADAACLQQIREKGELLSEEYTPDGIAVTAYVSQEIYGRLFRDCPKIIGADSDT